MRFAAKLVTIFVLLSILNVLWGTTEAAKDKDKDKDSDESDEKNDSKSNRSSKAIDKSKKYFKRNCKKSKKYQIEEHDDLVKYKNDLDCVFHQGYAPNKVPEGHFHGTLISMMKMDWFNGWLGFLWENKLIVKSSCNQKMSYIGWNSLAFAPVTPFTASVGPMDENFEKDEHDDGKDSVILDYTKDFSKICPDLKSNTGHSKSMHNTYPLNQALEALRIVGEKKDGRIIYLGRMYMRESHHGKKTATTKAYYSLTNYDPNITYTEPSGDNSEDSRSKLQKTLSGIMTSIRPPIL